MPDGKFDAKIFHSRNELQRKHFLTLKRMKNIKATLISLQTTIKHKTIQCYLNKCTKQKRQGLNAA